MRSTSVPGPSATTTRAASSREARLASYGLDPESIGRPAGRLLRWCLEIDTVVAGLAGLDGDTRPAAMAAEVLRLDLRRDFFMLEGLLRLYRRRFGKPVEKAHRRAKAVEDAIGRVDHDRSIGASAEAAGAPDRVVRHLGELAEAGVARLAKLLRKRWLPDPADGLVPGVARLVRLARTLEWGRHGKDRRYLCRVIAREMHGVRDEAHDLHELEAGVHEFRRDIRWFPIYFTALDGFATLDESLNPVPAYTSLLADPAAASPYAQLEPSPREPDPVRLSRSLYVANTKYIAELGDLKDRGQVVEGFANALRAAGVEPKRRRARVAALELAGSSEEEMAAIHARAEAIRDEAMSRRLYEHLAEPLDEASAGSRPSVGRRSRA